MIFPRMTCKWFEGCARAAHFEIKTTEGWKPMCRTHSDRYGHWAQIRRVEVKSEPATL